MGFSHANRLRLGCQLVTKRVRCALTLALAREARQGPNRCFSQGLSPPFEN